MPTSIIYKSNSKESITSVAKYIKGETVVRLNEDIIHLYTEPIYDAAEYYDTEYNISIESEDEDQLYSIVNGQPKYRIDHQVEVFIEKTKNLDYHKILDFGCAKGSAYKKLKLKKPNLDYHLFDVSEKYVKFWNEITSKNRCFTYQIPDTYKNHFDLITSFFVLEHVLDPEEILLKINSLLNDGGFVYLIVPNVYTNTADFILADHTHHYSENSLEHYLNKTNFEVIEVDSKSHNGAFIVIARKVSKPIYTNNFQLKTTSDVQAIVEYWNNIKIKTNQIEEDCKNKNIAIYGAGVYGNYILSLLSNISNIACFIDQSQYMQNKTIKNIKIMSPTKMIQDQTLKINSIIVALNPKNAKSQIESIAEFQHTDIQFIYL